MRDNSAIQSRASRLGGNAKPKLPNYEVPKWANDSKKYPSSVLIASDTPRKEIPKYTGTLVIGIATMHKSNAVPIISQEQAIDISRMRR